VVISTLQSVDYTFFLSVTPIFGAGADGAASAVFRDTANQPGEIINLSMRNVLITGKADKLFQGTPFLHDFDSVSILISMSILSIQWVCTGLTKRRRGNGATGQTKGQCGIVLTLTRAVAVGISHFGITPENVFGIPPASQYKR